MYDADLWFHGSSDVENPIIEGIFPETEVMLCEAFRRAGFESELTQDSVIKEFPKAIDLSVTDPKTGQTIYVEADGSVHNLNVGHDQNRELVYDGRTLFRAASVGKFAGNKRILHIDDDMMNLILKTMEDGTKHKKSGQFMSDRLCRAIFSSVDRQDPGVYGIRHDYREKRALSSKPQIKPFLPYQPQSLTQQTCTV